MILHFNSSFARNCNYSFSWGCWCRISTSSKTALTIRFLTRLACRFCLGKNCFLFCVSCAGSTTPAGWSSIATYVLSTAKIFCFSLLAWSTSQNVDSRSIERHLLGWLWGNQSSCSSVCRCSHCGQNRLTSMKTPTTLPWISVKPQPEICSGNASPGRRRQPPWLRCVPNHLCTPTTR